MADNKTDPGPLSPDIQRVWRMMKISPELWGVGVLLNKQARRNLPKV